MKTTALIKKGKDGTFGIFTPDLHHLFKLTGIDQWLNQSHGILCSSRRIGDDVLY